MQKKSFLNTLLHKQYTLLRIYVVPHAYLVSQEMVCEVSDLNGRQYFDFIEKCYLHQQQYYARGTKHKSEYTWNQLTAEALGTFPCKPNIFRNRFRRAIINWMK